MFKQTLLALSLAAASTAALALPNIAVLATGGTIAGAGASSTGSAYKAGAVSVNHLVDAVPQLAKIANVTPIQVTNIGSQDMSDEVWLKLAKTLASDCGKYDGFVITHGTDTMEETAYFLQLTTACKKPVVLVGAMLPSTGLSADGPRNLYNAVLTAATPDTAKQGVVVAMDNVVIGARDVFKSNTTQPETFQAMNFGKVGWIFNDKVTYEAVGLRAQLKAPFDVTKLDQLPKVGIVYNHENVDPSVVEEQGWEVLRNTDYAGHLYIYDSERDSFMMAFKALGYSMNTEDPDEINAAYEWLLQMNNTMSPVYVTDEVIDSMMNGYKDIAVVYSGDATVILDENEDMSFYMPSQGTNIWCDAMVIPANAENPKLAHEFINYMLTYEAAFDNTETVGYTSPNAEVFEEMTSSEDLYADNAAYLPRSGYDKDEMFHDNQTLMRELSKLWIKVKAAK